VPGNFRAARLFLAMEAKDSKGGRSRQYPLEIELPDEREGLVRQLLLQFSARQVQLGEQLARPSDRLESAVVWEDDNGIEAKDCGADTGQDFAGIGIEEASRRGQQNEPAAQAGKYSPR
jgi:hypothetical protein